MTSKNGRKFFYQWELNQRLIVDEDCTMVQFANGTLPNALGVEVKEEDGTRYAEVPNILLQTAADLHAYAWNEETTSVVDHTVFSVWAAAKPAQYAYTQTEVKQYDMLLKELEEKTGYYMPDIDEDGNLSWQKSMESLPDIKGVNIRGPQGPQGEQGPQGDPGEVNIDDTTVDTNAWSSKNIVDKLCPSFTETGAMVACEPVEGYPLEVISEVHSDGQPLSSVTLHHTGKNLVGFNDFSGITSTNRTMYCTDGVHKSVFTGSVYTTYIVTGVTQYMKNTYLAPGTYVFSINQESTGARYNNCYATVTLEDGTTVKLSDGKAVTLTQPGNVTNFRCLTNTGFTAGTEITFTLQIEAGSVATEYEPYRGESFTANVNQPAYTVAKTFDTGSRYEIMADENEILSYYSELGTVDTSVAPVVLDDDGIWTAYFDGEDLIVSCDSNYYFENYPAYPTVQLQFYESYVFDYNWTTGVLTDKDGNETQLTAQPIQALDGVNILFSDTSDTTVKGKKDPVKVIENLTNAIIALGGNV